MSARAAGAPGRRAVKDRALIVGNRLGVKLIPRLPGGLKRLLSGGRAVTIDGNTLDPSL